ncbi:MAG: hypothetical protein PHZ07_04890 [Patescibacteria group bacterium]|nr:hypothetical protein [Patescibacteria group bacterium]
MKKSECTQVYKGFTIVVKRVVVESKEWRWSSWTTTTTKSFTYSIPGKVNEEVSGYRNANAAFKAAHRIINNKLKL